MDKPAEPKTVHGDTETEYGAWPKKRTLIIGARDHFDFVCVARLVKQFRKDVRKFKQRSGRHHGIAYGGPEDRNVYIWYTTHQITIHFGD